MATEVERRRARGNDAADVAAKSVCRLRVVLDDGLSESALDQMHSVQLECYRLILDEATKREHRQSDLPLDTRGESFRRQIEVDR
jgi:hypothetical protein